MTGRLLIVALIIHTHNAFIIPPAQHQNIKQTSFTTTLEKLNAPSSRSTTTITTATTTTLRMSDFGGSGLLPELTPLEKMQQAADRFIVSFEESLGEGVPAPPELAALGKARDDPDTSMALLTQRTYELMIERGMLYDVDPETGVLTPTNYDIKANLDEPAVKSEFGQLYKYGMNLIARGLISVDDAKEIVKKRLIARTGLSPDEFDKWLGY